MEKAPLGITAEYDRPNGAVRTEGGRRIESGSVGRHEWSFGRWGSVMTQEVLWALPYVAETEQAGPCYGGSRLAGSRLMRSVVITYAQHISSPNHISPIGSEIYLS